MIRLESILVKTKTFKMFVMNLKCVLFMSIIAFLSQRKLNNNERAWKLRALRYALLPSSSCMFAMCGAMFVDMSKAFDRVQHSKLVQKLASVGVGGAALRWFADYLTGRTQQVVVGDARGSTEPCSRGVPQGCVLGSLLFCIKFYIRRTPQKFQHCRALLSADDIAFYVIGRKASTVLRMLQTDLLNLEDFLSERGLVLNPKKSPLFLLRRPAPHLDVIPSITCKGTVIPESSHGLYLGLLLPDSSLSFDQQVERVCAKAQCKVASFRHGPCLHDRPPHVLPDNCPEYLGLCQHMLCSLLVR